MTIVTLSLYAHPFSSYCQKVLTSLYENATDFTYRELGPGDPEAGAELARLWPIGRFPVLVDGKLVLPETTIIIEHLDLHHPGPVRLIPADPDNALQVRLLDRFFDNYVMTPMQTIVLNQLRPVESRDPYGVDEARKRLETAYAWLEQRLASRGATRWIAGDDFSLADCAAAPSLFYADWAHQIAATFPQLRAYRQRLNQRPSFARCIDAARPYRPFFPLGAPDRD
jgi:glutathione S-transferase